MKEKMSSEERINILNEQDQNGACFIHYVTALNYYEMITLLHDNGADINLLTKSGLSPIVIAAAKGHEKSVKRLMRLGAVFGQASQTLED